MDQKIDPLDPMLRPRTSVERAVSTAEHHGVKLVRFLYVDNGGLIRGKATAAGRLPRRIADGVGLVVGMQAMTPLDQLVPIDGLGSVGEVRLVPDVDTFRILPYAPSSAAMIADMQTQDGTPWDVCPRSFLKRQIAAGRDAGFSARAAFECEFTLASRDANGVFWPIEDTACFSTTGMTVAAKIIDEIVGALQKQEITVEEYYPENGFGQHEISLAHQPALGAADQQVYFRETVRNVAFNHGAWASFAPKPFPDLAGNGAHLHVSLWDAAGAETLMYAPDHPSGLSPLGRQFSAGVLAHLPALVALTCSSVNSYRRLRPHAWSSAFVCWGLDNREAALRVPSTFASDRAGSTNVELKASDSSANPYLALGSVIAAGLDGIRRRLELPEPIQVDPANLSDAERTMRGIARLPTSLSDALDNLERDEVLLRALGAPLARAFLGVKRAEVATYAAQDEQFELRNHFWKY